MELDDVKTFPELLIYLEKFSNPSAFNYRENNTWYPISHQDFLQTVRFLALGLHKLGIKKGDFIGILTDPSPWWAMMDLAIAVTGACSVPQFANVAKENFRFQVETTGMKTIFVSGKAHWKMAEAHRDCFDNIITRQVNAQGDDLIGWNCLVRLGQKLDKEDPHLYDKLRKQVHENDLFTILFTSGSTGVPKGVEITHRGLMFQVKTCQDLMRYGPRDRGLNVIPLAHVMGRLQLYLYMQGGMSFYFMDNVLNIPTILCEVKPTTTIMVPRMLEKFQAAMFLKASQIGGRKGQILRWGLDLANKKNPSTWDRIQMPIADKLVFGKMRQFFGGRLRHLIIGGSSLDKDLCQFYHNMDIPVIEGYGMTEASCCIAINHPGKMKAGTCGPIFPDTEIKISDEGEVLCRGPHIMPGYHKNPEATAEAIDEDGWLHSGDKGEFTEEGYLRIKGRFKELFKTSGAKYVSPVPIEQALCRSHPLIEMAVVVADGKKFPSCLLFPDFTMVEELKTKEECISLSDEDFLAHPKIAESIQNCLVEVNGALNHWEKIQKFRIVPQRPSVEGGELTSTLKVRRHIINEKYKKFIESMYVPS